MHFEYVFEKAFKKLAMYIRNNFSSIDLFWCIKDEKKIAHSKPSSRGAIIEFEAKLISDYWITSHLGCIEPLPKSHEQFCRGRLESPNLSENGWRIWLEENEILEQIQKTPISRWSHSTLQKMSQLSGSENTIREKFLCVV